MKHTLLYLLLFCSLFAAAQPNDTRGIGSIEQTDPTATGTRRALIIGIDKYKNIKQLNYAAEDARMFRDYLVDNKAAPVPVDNITLLLDSDATSGHIFKELRKLTNLSKANDEVIVYFAGHGDIDDTISAGFLLAYNCDQTVYSGSDVLELSLFERNLQAIAKKGVKVILVTDACRSGNLIGGKMGAETTMNSLNAMFKNITKILSCQPGELSEESKFGTSGHGVFTYYLVSGMSGMADENNDNNVSLDELEFYIRNEVKKETDGRQHPKVDGNLSQIIAKVDKDNKNTVAKRIEEHKKGTAVASRGMGDDMLTKLDAPSKILFNQFKEHVKAGKLNGAGNDHAYGDYLAAVKQNKSEFLQSYLRDELEAEMEDATQEWLNYYLRGEMDKYVNWKIADFEDAADKLQIAMDLLDKSDLRYNEIAAKRLFFEAIPLKKLVGNEKYVKGIQYLLQADSLFPNQPYVLNMLGMFYKDQKKPDYAKAIAYFEKSITLYPKWTYSYLSLGNLYHTKKDYDKAYHYYEKATNINPADAVPVFNMGSIFLQRDRDTIKALQYYREAISLGPDFANPYSVIGQLFMEKQQYDSALVYFEKGKKVDPTDFNVYANLGSYYFELKDYDQSLVNYQLAVSNATDTAVWVVYKGSIGQAYEKMKNHEEALKYYQETLKLDSNSTDALLGIGVYHMGKKDYPKAMDYLSRAIAVDTDAEMKPILLATKASLYFTMGKDELAYTTYLEALKLDPNSAMANQGIFNILFQQQHYAEAKPYLTKALAINPDNYDANTSLMLVAMMEKDFATALKALNKCVQLQPENPASYYNLACYYSLQNDSEHALANLENCFKKGFNDTEHLKADTDLDNIRNQPAYNNLLAKYFSK